MKNLLKLTCAKTHKTILIGTESIISIEDVREDIPNPNYVSKIQSRGAMIATFFVKESIEDIYNQHANN
jgi:hypothetical protein